MSNSAVNINLDYKGFTTLSLDDPEAIMVAGSTYNARKANLDPELEHGNPELTTDFAFTDLVARMSEEVLKSHFVVDTKPHNPSVSRPALVGTKVAKEAQANQPTTSTTTPKIKIPLDQNVANLSTGKSGGTGKAKPQSKPRVVTKVKINNYQGWHHSRHSLMFKKMFQQTSTAPILTIGEPTSPAPVLIRVVPTTVYPDASEAFVQQLFSMEGVLHMLRSKSRWNHRPHATASTCWMVTPNLTTCITMIGLLLVGLPTQAVAYSYII